MALWFLAVQGAECPATCDSHNAKFHLPLTQQSADWWGIATGQPVSTLHSWLLPEMGKNNSLLGLIQLGSLFVHLSKDTQWRYKVKIHSDFINLAVSKSKTKMGSIDISLPSSSSFTTVALKKYLCELYCTYLTCHLNFTCVGHNHHNVPVKGRLNIPPLLTVPI